MVPFMKLNNEKGLKIRLISDDDSNYIMGAKDLKNIKYLHHNILKNLHTLANNFGTYWNIKY